MSAGYRNRLPLALLLALCPAASAGVVSSPYGVNVHAPSGKNLQALFDAAQAAGIGWVRIDFVWAFVEPAPGIEDWTLYDEIAAAARARDLEILALVAYTPDWATDGPPISGVPSNPSDWADFCFRAADRYRSTIRHWEIWNEPNLDQFWAGSRSQYVEQILVPGAAAIRLANPSARIGGPALAHLTSGDADWYRWLLEILEGAGSSLDFASHHVYAGNHQGVTEKLEENTVFGDVPELWDVATPSLREVLAEAAWAGAVWLTETGWASDQVGEQPQATYYGGLLGQWLTGGPGRDWIQKIFFYELHDQPLPPLYGILRADRTPKPAYFAYRNFVLAHPPSPLVFADGFESGDLSAWSSVTARR